MEPPPPPTLRNLRPSVFGKTGAGEGRKTTKCRPYQFSKFTSADNFKRTQNLLKSSLITEKKKCLVKMRNVEKLHPLGGGGG